MSDPIPPPTARRPEEVLELVSLALSDGDLEAALAQYERGALLRPWAGTPGGPGVPDTPEARESRESRDAAVGDDDRVGDILRCLMELRLPLSAQVRAVLPTCGLALVIGERHLAGTGPGGQRVSLTGLSSTVVRQQPDGTWRIVADAWHLDGPGLPDVRH